MTTLPPGKLAVYYGYPSVVNGSTGTSGAADVFKDYDVVVFGSGLEVPSHPDHTNTIAVIGDALMTNTDVYGYIDATLTLNDIQGKIDQWYDMGVVGIFLDQFGYDFAVSRERQREILWCVHCKGLKAFVNAWNPDDAFSPAVEPTYNPSGLATRMGSDDIYLAESYQVVFGAYDTSVAAWEAKVAKMESYRTTYGSKMATVSTWDSSAYDQAKWDYSYYSSAQRSFDLAGFGEEFYSASSALLPFRPRKVIYGDHFTGSIISSSGVLEHQTNIGIQVDTNSFTVKEVLDLV